MRVLVCDVKPGAACGVVHCVADDTVAAGPEACGEGFVAGESFAREARAHDGGGARGGEGSECWSGVGVCRRVAEVEIGVSEAVDGDKGELGRVGGWGRVDEREEGDCNHDNEQAQDDEALAGGKLAIEG